MTPYTMNPAAQRTLDGMRLDIIEKLLRSGELVVLDPGFDLTETTKGGRQWIMSYPTLLSVADAVLDGSAHTSVTVTPAALG